MLSTPAERQKRPNAKDITGVALGHIILIWKSDMTSVTVLWSSGGLCLYFVEKQSGLIFVSFIPPLLHLLNLIYILLTF